MALFDAMIGLRVRNATYRAYFEDSPEEITEATASRDLQKLVQSNLREPRGERRGRHYVAKPALTAIRQGVRLNRTPRDNLIPSVIRRFVTVTSCASCALVTSSAPRDRTG
jgi:hypothetical protein